ncbi:hypothetical protein [Burkholderia multivorans]|uniref:hypothetical protein n=1 Tax=Burkholderia multivorans TaxID=87883 RepID=UPI000CFE52FC|nr:hypothetical protein [Burkholderia multivorans]PRF73666.1 hypothetical protein C6Q12_20555 [Burkholderia multivorans]
MSDDAGIAALWVWSMLDTVGRDRKRAGMRASVRVFVFEFVSSKGERSARDVPARIAQRTRAA